MAKVYWLAKATFSPLLLFFVRFSSGLTSFNSLSVLSPSTFLLCSLFLVCPLCFSSSSSIVFFFCLCFSFLSLCLFFFCLPGFLCSFLHSCSLLLVRSIPHSSSLSLDFIKLENVVRSCLKIMRHVRLCFEKKQGPTVLPLQDYWSRHLGIWIWHRGGEVGSW